MKREVNCDYVKELFYQFYTYLCIKHNVLVNASIKTNFEFYTREFLRKPLNMKRMISLAHSTIGYYNSEDDEITIFLRKEFCNNAKYPVLLHVLGHEYRHKLQREADLSYRDVFLFYIEHMISYFDRNYYTNNHEGFYMEMDADKWGLEELNCFLKDNISEFNDFINNNIEKRFKVYNSSAMFDHFNDVVGKVSNNYFGIWGLVDLSLHGYSNENKKKIVSVLRDLYNHDGKLSVSPYNIGNVNPEIKDIVTKSKIYSKR